MWLLRQGHGRWDGNKIRESEGSGHGDVISWRKELDSPLGGVRSQETIGEQPSGDLTCMWKASLLLPGGDGTVAGLSGRCVDFAHIHIHMAGRTLDRSSRKRH